MKNLFFCRDSGHLSDQSLLHVRSILVAGNHTRPPVEPLYYGQKITKNGENWRKLGTEKRSLENKDPLDNSVQRVFIN